MARAGSIAATLLLASLLGGCPAKEPCSGGLTECGGRCVDAQGDPTACGPGCAVCPVGGTCVAGACQCPGGQVDCGGTCVDTTGSDAHCGGCDQPCGLGACVSSACTCDAGATPCPGAWPRCVDTLTDEGHCGGCGSPCRMGEACTGGACACLPGLTDCTTACFDTSRDEQHCGDCVTACASGATCVPGVAPGDGDCTCPPATPEVCGAAPGRCVDRATDPTACGAGCLTCPTGGRCTTGTCACPAALPTLCGSDPGACVDTLTDEAHCGACDAACAGGKTCTSGACCSPGQFVCVGTAKTCCGGTGCCAAGACQTQHANGLGQAFFDCNPAGTHTAASAASAANAWAAGTATYPDLAAFGCPSCYGRQTGSACAVWCYDPSPLTGRVHLNAISNQCLCPSTLDPTWN